MNKAEAKQAVELARNTDIDLSNENIDVFDGYGLPNFQPVHVTTRQVARLIRWQAMPIMRKANDPDLLSEELNELLDLGRKRFLIIA